jgi:hypothetical protein
LDNESDLLVKIEKLRVDLFWTKTVGAVLFLLLVVTCVANCRSHPTTVVASEFLLQDKAGNVVARLGQDAGDTCLTLRANQDVSIAELCVQNSEGASLDLHNLKSESRALLTPGFTIREPLYEIRPAMILSNRNQIIGRIPANAVRWP